MHLMSYSSEKVIAESQSALSDVSVIIPTYNAGRFIPSLREAIALQGISPAQVFVIDSSSTDATQFLVKQAGFQLQTISPSSFRHGKTRQMAVNLAPYAKILIYMTQDALPSDAETFTNLVKAFSDPLVGSAYGRQLPRREADPIERHGRLFNYPDQSCICSLQDKERLGIRAAFSSNSFAAYRREALCEIGGFPSDAIVSEEIMVVAQMLLAGWKSAYQADATVYHSHPLTFWKELSRYFDIGVQHARAKWLLETFGNASGEGKKFVMSEMRYLWDTNPTTVVEAGLRTVGKLVGYQLGRWEHMLPRAFKRYVSSQKSFWTGDKDNL